MKEDKNMNLKYTSIYYYSTNNTPIISDDNMYHYLYQITNIINGNFYIGIHSTTNLDDNYFGSGKRLKNAIKKYGKSNFIKTNIEFFKNRVDLSLKESIIVDYNFCNNENTYNIANGGFDSWSKDRVVVKDNLGNNMMVLKTDPRYISGELISNLKGLVPVKDSLGYTYKVTKDDPRYISGELIHINKGLINVVDIHGNRFKVSKYDPRYISGELQHITKGFKHSKETIDKAIQSKKDNGSLYHSEETKKILSEKAKKFNADRRFIHSIEEKRNRLILKTEPLPNGWVEGRKGKF